MKSCRYNKTKCKYGDKIRNCVKKTIGLKNK